MPALTRNQARQLRAEGKTFQDPAQLGNQAPPDPPKISRPRRSNARVPRARPTGAAGTNAPKRRKRARGTTRSKKNTGRRTCGRADVRAATAAREDIVEDERHQHPPHEEDRNVTPPAEEATHADGVHQSPPPEADANSSPAETEAPQADEEPQDPLPGPRANVQPPEDPYDLLDIDEYLFETAIGFRSETSGTHGGNSTHESAEESMSEQSSQGETPAENLVPLTRDEAEAGGGLEIPNVGEPTLTNEIHNLWGNRHWRFDPQHSYGDDGFHSVENRPNREQQREILGILTPARRLASLWLTRPEYQGFWATILFGPDTYDGANNLWNLEPIELTPERSREVEERLEDIAARHHFIFAPPPRYPRRMASTLVIDPDDPQTWRGTEFAPGYVTFLHPNFESVVRSDGQQGRFREWPLNTRCERLRYLFFLAVTLGGAVAELLWMDRCRRGMANQIIRRRPRILIRHLHPYSDLNNAFQEFILGGRLVQGAPMALNGLALRVIRNLHIRDGVVAPDSRTDVGIVRMEGIRDRFSENWWRTAGRARITATIQVTYAWGEDEYTLH
ncbi:MAG: hypothetical protein Q9182_004624 [Xanthomendoza sp. 2 TL-2023]